MTGGERLPRVRSSPVERKRGVVSITRLLRGWVSCVGGVHGEARQGHESIASGGTGEGEGVGEVAGRVRLRVRRRHRRRRIVHGRHLVRVSCFAVGAATTDVSLQS